LNAVSQELNFCFAYIPAAFTPQIAKMGEPYPLITYIFCSTVCLIAMCIIGPQKNKKEKK
jgi:hypothetical protein